MEQASTRPRKSYSASYFRSHTVLWGSLLFLVTQVVQLIQLFEEAATRSKAGQRPPEDYTTAGIIAKVVVIGLIFACVILLRRHQSGKSRMRRNQLYLLVGFLLTVWAVTQFIDTFLNILVFPEFIWFLDCLSIAICIIAPIVLLVIADLNGIPPDDNILLFLGIGGIGFTAISTIIIGIVLKASYSLPRLIPELMFRAGLILFGVAALQKALRLRAAHPFAAPVEPARKPAKESAPKRVRESEPFTLHLDNEFSTDSERQYTARTPRPEQGSGQQYTTRTPRPDAAQAPGAYTARTPRPEQSNQQQYTARTPRPGAADASASYTPRTSRLEQEPASWQTGRMIIQGGTGRIHTQQPGSVPAERQTCPYCGKRMPLGFPNCPRCGQDME